MVMRRMIGSVNNMTNGLVTVSYTHLDVYKRQATDNASVTIMKIEIKSIQTESGDQWMCNLVEETPFWYKAGWKRKS